MSLASTQSAIDSALSSTLSSIASAQTTYFGTYGKYWQGLISHATLPADGNSVAADNTSLTPTDQIIDWATFGVTPGTIPCALRVDTYKDQDGNDGYTVTKIFIYSGSQYSTTTDSGNEPARADAWDTVPDPVPEMVETYSATAEAYCTVGADTSGVGTSSWSGATNIYADDTSYASIDSAGTSSTSHYLLAKTFGFAVPSTAVIDGVEFTVRRIADSNASHDRASDSTVKMFYSGSAVGSNQSTGSNWSTSEESKVFGGATSTFGYSGYLTPTVVNAATFGLGLSISIEECIAQVDYVKCKVYYTVDALRATPTITSLDVSSGTTAGGTAITITGTGFKNGCTVTFGGDAATSIVVASSTSITCVTPAHSAGAVDVVITNTDGKSVTSSGGYTYAVTTPAFVKYGSGTASSTSDLTLSLSSGSATAGNCLLAIIKHNSGGSVSSSSGWTQLQSGTNSTTCWYKIAAGGDSAVWTWGGSAKADKAQGIMIELSGSNASSPIDVSAASTSTFTTPSVTTTTATLVVSLGGGSITTDFETQPSGWTLALHGSTHNGTGIAYKVFSSAGATGTADWNNAGSEVKVFTVAVKA